MRSIVPPVLAGAAALALAPAVWTWAPPFEVPSLKAGLSGSNQARLLQSLLDDAVGMLTTGAIGLFVLAGFTVKAMIDGPRRLRGFDQALLLAFLAFQLLAFNTGFMARSEALDVAALGSGDIGFLGEALAVQALQLHLAFVCFVMLATRAMAGAGSAP